MEDDLKCLVRHKDWRLCPTGSFAFSWRIDCCLAAKDLQILATRNGKFSTILSQSTMKGCRRGLALFRTERSAYQNLSSKSSYLERLSLRDECGVGVHRKVNHLDRHVGALIAQASGMSLESIRQWGLWRRDCMTGKHLVLVKAIAKLSALRSLYEMAKPRFRWSNEWFCQCPQVLRRPPRSIH